MNIRSIRRITADSNHNAFTGAIWFKGALYVAFRQGDAHVCNNGKLVVMRSRDEGVHFDIVAVLRGDHDTRDAHLFSDGQRLFATGFEYDTRKAQAVSQGAAWTENGVNWSPWTRFTGTANLVLWRPRYFKGRYYCAGYGYPNDKRDGTSLVDWFESGDGLNWKKIRTLREGPDQPNECALDFKPDGTAAILMRRGHASHRPLLLIARPPYEKWLETELDIPLLGPALWFVDDDIWIAGRWFLGNNIAHLAIFKIKKGQPSLQVVLPSGPGTDCSYMGVARHPDNPRRFAFSYYSGHVAPDDPTVDQWTHPDIYLADIAFEPCFIESWKVSELQSIRLQDAYEPDPNNSRFKWSDFNRLETDLKQVGFVDAHEMIANRPGIMYFVANFDVGPCDSGDLFLGYDGPVAAWVNGTKVFEGPGDNPATPDKTKISLDRKSLKPGLNRLAIALDTNQGKAWGIFARYEPAQTEYPEA